MTIRLGYHIRMIRDRARSAPSIPLTDRLALLLSQLGYHSSQRFTELLRPLGLHPKHAGLLMNLAAAEGRSQKRLADTIGIHRNAMVKLIDDLEERGLAERRRHPDDRRAYAVHLTDAARELLPRAEQVADEHEAELFGDLDESERDQLRDLLKRVLQQTGLSAGIHPGLQEEPAAGTRRSC